MNLTSITIPCLTSNLDDVDQLLTWWSDPRMAPLRPGESAKPIVLCIVLNRADSSQMQAFHEVFDRHEALHQVFSECRVMEAGLEGDRDLYVRDVPEAKGEFGNKAGPNFLFLETMRMLHPLGGFTFQNEVDCYPLKAGWLTDLHELVDARRFAWVIGSIYTGEYPVNRNIQYHLNGNAIYHAGDPRFLRFVNEYWEPRLLEFAGVDPNLAYDCWWAIEVSRAQSALKNHSWELVSTYGQYMCTCQFLINILHEATILSDIDLALRQSETSGQSALFVHGHVVTPLIQTFMEGDGADFAEFLAGQSAAASETDGRDWLDDAVEDNEIEMLVSLNSVAANAVEQVDVHKPLSVDTVPVHISIDDIPRQSFLGNWHVESKKDHIWALFGISGLNFDFTTPQTRVLIKLHGNVAEGLPAEAVTFNAYGATLIDVAPQSDGSVLFDIQGDSVFSSVSLTIDVTQTARVEGDERDLGYVLFGVSVLEPEIAVE